MIILIALLCTSCAHQPHRPTVGQLLLKPIDWVAHLGLSSVEVALGVVVAPFDRGKMLASGTNNLRATVLNPISAADRLLARRDHVRVIALCRQPDGSIARAMTEIINGEVKEIRYDAYFVAASKLPRDSTPPTSQDTPVLPPFFVTGDNVQNVIIDPKEQVLTLPEIIPMTKPDPAEKRTGLHDSVLRFLQDLNAVTLPQYTTAPSQQQ